MTAENSRELIELMRKCDRSADQLLRRENCMLMVREAINKTRPLVQIEMGAIDAIQVRSVIQNIICLRY